MSRLVRLDVGAPSREARGRSMMPGAQGGLLHRLTPRIGVIADDAPSPPLSTRGLDETDLLAIRAWDAHMTPRAPLPSRAWDAPGFKSPVHMDEDPAESIAPVVRSARTRSRTMTGTIAVGVVIVSRDQGPEAISAAEQTQIMEQVFDGTDFLARAEPKAKITFDYDLRPVTISVDPNRVGRSSDPYERAESPWRDAALTALGFGKGRKAYRAYVESITQAKGADSGYVAFFTKYPVHHFAYAVYEKVVMSFDNDGWGTANLGRVFAHETCHIFGAADEYGSCDCDETSGVLNARNGNCVNCTGRRVQCLMEQNVYKLCKHSRLQLGWGAPYV